MSAYSIFDLRNEVIGDYEQYVRGFLRIKSQDVQDAVDAALDGGLLWPDPAIQLNPSFEQGESIRDLISEGLLHPACENIFSIDDKPINLYKHQEDAIRCACDGKNYVLTTGTGSGKSLSYIIPIISHIHKTGTNQGIQAIIVYPMNALVNSQIGELEKFLKKDRKASPVTFERYTGQESREDKERIRKNPPDILLTNYMMLELILTRADELPLVRQMGKLRFLVLDELHTYRGRQGADVAMLARRTVEASKSKKVLCVGTSATLASGSRRESQKEIARVATAIFGQNVEQDCVVMESLVRATEEYDPAAPDALANLRRETQAFAAFRKQNPDADAQASSRELCAVVQFDDPLPAIKNSALASWIESNAGIKREEESGALVRQKPAPIKGENGLAQRLADLLEIAPDVCERAIEFMLLCGSEIPNEGGRKFFAFKLHQFIIGGETVSATLEPEGKRGVRMRSQRFDPDGGNKVLFPLVSCEECGKEFYCVRKVAPSGKSKTVLKFAPRMPLDTNNGDEGDKNRIGYLSLLPETPARTQEEWEQYFLDNIPDAWRDEDGGLDKNRKKDLPQIYRVNPQGEPVPPSAEGVNVVFTPSPFRFCPECFAAWTPMSARTARSDGSRLSSFNGGGRSSATSILSLYIAEWLRKKLPVHEGKENSKEERKLLSFTDNRQDASLQAGHFNDFIEVSVQRGALSRALDRAGERGLTYEEIASEVLKEIDLDVADYSLLLQEEFEDDEEEDGKENKPTERPTLKGRQLAQTTEALKKALRFRIMRDLRRGWRILLPNLAQTGLLKIEYADLDALVANANEWKSASAPLFEASPEKKKEVVQTLLDVLRGELAISCDELQSDKQGDMLLSVRSFITEDWGFDSVDTPATIESATFACPGPKPAGFRHQEFVFFSERGAFGEYLRNALGIPKGNRAVVAACIRDLFDILAGSYKLLVRSIERGQKVYQIPATAIIWKKGDGKTGEVDRTRQTNISNEGHVNEFFRDFYTNFFARDEKNPDEAPDICRLRAREHTAQVDSAVREKREKAFRKGELPILYCSPTMELGVDIANLHVVHMRNIPPTPANYAQRSGRAGRSGQSALIVAYCASGSPHDRYYFNNPHLAISGEVRPPQIDLGNEELIRSHVYAVWMTTAIEAEVDFKIGGSLKTIIQVPLPESNSIKCYVKEDILSILDNEELRKQAFDRAKTVLGGMMENDSIDAGWLTNDWLHEQLKNLRANFKRACERWINLHEAADEQRDFWHKRMFDGRFSHSDQNDAVRLRAQAESELKILENERQDSREEERSEFYSYRYLASEGFLPGYNFPRLPVIAYLPGSKGRYSSKGEAGYLSRPRFLAISEFGPRAIIYHEGSRFVVDRVSFSVSDRSNDDESKLVTKSAFICPKCGYYHDGDGGESGKDAPSKCENPSCKNDLGAPYRNLLRMTRVSAKRRQRISCDEEERLRLGYDVQTSYRFAKREHGVSARMAEIKLPDGSLWGTLTWGQSADIYRISNGYRMQKPADRIGYWIDVDQGRWVSAPPEDGLSDEEKKALGKSPTVQVRPYVQDTRNCVVLVPAKELQLTLGQTASLQAALQRAMERVFSVEDRELAAFPLPGGDERERLLFYEAAEGGAGALRKLLDPARFKDVIYEALRVIHFNPETGEDEGHAPGTTDACVAACYDCLMSYGNQPDHELLNRHEISDILLKLREAKLEVSSGPSTRQQLFESLERKTESELERKWLRFVYDAGLKLPTDAQKHFDEPNTTPDFYYAGDYAAIYIDGPHHDAPDTKETDRKLRSRLFDELGVDYIVFRFDDQDRWMDIVRDNAAIFALEER